LLALRMTTRGWMVTVAILAIALGYFLELKRLQRRREAFRLIAERHVKIAEYYRRSRPGSASAEYHAAHARHYDAASRRWSLVAP
jgi:hypothetical protein